MSAPPPSPMPDFNAMAASFDRFLPLIEPVGLAVLDHLPSPAAGATVLDVACGTGEPGLTLARRSPGIHLLGVDTAPAAIDLARAKAARESLEQVRFEVMSSDALALADGSVDGAISRFGLLMFGDVPASARELTRVLRPGGHFSLAVWDDFTRNTLVHALTELLRPHRPEGHESPLHRLNALAHEGVRAGMLKEAGMAAVDSEMFTWVYAFDSFDEAWDLLGRMGMITGQATLAPDAQEQVKIELEASLAAYRQASGGYRIPHACRIFWGRR